jgi:hypothetical protein
VTWYQGISGTVGLICLGIALVMWTIGGRMYPTWILGLTITGVGGIMSTPVGAWIRNTWSWLTGAVGSTVGRWSGIAVITAVIMIVGVIIVLNVIGQFGAPGLKQAPGDEGNPEGISGRTIGLGALFAFTAGTLPGTVGSAASTILGALAHVVALPIAAGLGLL